MAKRDCFLFYRSFFDAVSLMPTEIQAEVYPAIIEYALDGKVPKQLSDIAKGVFILVKPNIDATIARKENGRKGAKYGKLGGRPQKKDKAPSPGKASEDTPAPKPGYTLTLQQEIDQMLADRTWNEPVCMQFRITADDLSKRLAGFHNHCQCEYDGKPHKDINDAKRHFISWMRKVYAPVKEDKKPEQPSYEFNGGFGGQDT